ncbi:MAG TPA: DUF1360 domain-containing protein [Verrucomicrobiae bacterium]|nr:DUF1360 domain-containing protein [Verrucomicrobiae bacterium]
MKNGRSLKVPVTKKIRQSYLRNAPGKESFPLGGYAVLMTSYAVLFAGLYRAAVLKRKKIPEALSPRDLALLGTASYKISRLITKSLVASPLRSPFTEYGESMGAAEIYEKSRGRGLMNAFGDLITCPWCFGGWTAMASFFGLTFYPRFTRATASIFTVSAISDALNLLYDILKKHKK